MIDEKDIRIDDIPDGFRDVVDVIGLDNALRLVDAVGGSPLYVPTTKEVSRGARDRAIRAEFDGCNHRELAKKYNLSLTWIRTILGVPGRRSHASGSIDKQLSLF